MVDGVVDEEKQRIAGRRRRGAEATQEDGDETRQEEETRDSSGGDKKMMERSVSKSVDSSLSLSENSSTEEEEKLQEEGHSSVEGSGGMDDGRAAAAAAAVAAAVQQQQERQLQQQHLPPPRGEAASLQNALEQQQQEEQKLFLEQLEGRGSLRWRKKSVARDASASFPVSPASSSSKDGHAVAAAAAAGAWRRPSVEAAVLEEDIDKEERKGGSSRRKVGKSPSSSSRRGKAVSKASLTDISSVCTSAARPHAARALSPVHRPTWPAAAAASAEAAAGAGAAAAAGELLLAGKERGTAAAAASPRPPPASSATAASSASPVGAPVGRSRGSVGWTAAAGYHHRRRSSSTGRPQQHVQEACFDDVIVRPFEEQDAAAVRRLCYRHFRSLTLPSVFFWICHHSVDAAALFCISLCFLPIRGVLLSAACFFIYLLLRGVYEFELYIKRDCPDLDDIYQSYMRSRASGFWVAERLERSVSSPQQTAAASSGGERGNSSSSGNSTPDDGAASPHAKRRIVGCIGLAPLQTDKKTAQLVRLVVDRSQRRQHIGTLLLNTLIAYALQQHYSIIRLYTNNLNSDSIRFAKTKGFELQQIVRRGLMRGDLLKWQKKLEVPGMAQQRKTRPSKLVSSVLD